MNSIHEQLKFETNIPKIIGNADYDNHLAELKIMDDLCQNAGIDDEICRILVEQAQRKSDVSRAKKGLGPKALKAKTVRKICQNGRTFFRAALLRKRTGESLRNFCCRTAESPARQQFCRINRFAHAKIFSKSSLSAFENNLPAEALKKLHAKLIQAACQPLEAGDKTNAAGLASPLSMSHCYADSTCLKATIHYPVDWLLLRDATRTIMLACERIRKAGLLNRMPKNPKKFISDINNLCMQMTQCRRKKNSKQTRKNIFRLMKKLLKKVTRHGLRHAELLEKHWPKTQLSRLEAEDILNRIRHIQRQLPAAIFQAHERIIGGRRVASDQKILSLYEDHLHVIVRGKAGGEVEFGNTLLLVEQAEGLIVDFELCREKSPGDPTLLLGSISRIESLRAGPIQAVGTDRGFDSPTVRKLLNTKKIVNAVCPKSVPAYIEQRKNSCFRGHQKRRAQTEARIAVLNGFSGNPQRQKGFAHREIHLALSVISHNIRKVAALRLAHQTAPPGRLAA